MAENPQQPPLAYLDGQPLCEPPPALYIPPQPLRVKLERFEGPLDLLLHLIRKNRFSISDLPVAELCRQYLLYLEAAAKADMELAADYLAMAATLVEMKSRLFLPRAAPPEEEGEDPRARLVERLAAYAKIQQAARDLDALPRRGRDFSCPMLPLDLPSAPAVKPRISSAGLLEAYAAAARRLRLRRPYRLGAVAISLPEVMRRLREYFSEADSAEFFHLLNCGKRYVGATLLGVLHLASSNEINLLQEENGRLWAKRAKRAPVHNED